MSHAPTGTSTVPLHSIMEGLTVPSWPKDWGDMNKIDGYIEQGISGVAVLTNKGRSHPLFNSTIYNDDSTLCDDMAKIFLSHQDQGLRKDFCKAIQNEEHILSQRLAFQIWLNQLLDNRREQISQALLTLIHRHEYLSGKTEEIQDDVPGYELSASQKEDVAGWDEDGSTKS